MPKADKFINRNNTRINWGKEYSFLPTLDLLAVQKDSYAWFLEKGIGEILQEISPIDDFTEKNWTLIFKDYRIGKPPKSTDFCITKGITFDAPLYVSAELLNKKTNKTIKQEVFLGDIPQMTERGTFIINGVERTIVNQLVRSPGAYFTVIQDNVTGKKIYTAEIRPVHGSWLEFSTTRHETITVRIDRRRRFLATTFLRALGISSNDNIREKFKEAEGQNAETSFINNTLKKDETPDSQEALTEIFKKMHPGEPIVIEKIKESFFGMFFNARRYDLGKVGRYKINKKLNDTPGFKSSQERVLTIDDIIATICFLIDLVTGRIGVDDIDI